MKFPLLKEDLCSSVFLDDYDSSEFEGCYIICSLMFFAFFLQIAKVMYITQNCLKYET